MNKQTDLNLILDGIEERANKAIEGPWFTAFDDLEAGPHTNSGLALIETGRTEDWWPARLCEWPTAEFIAASRTDNPALVKALRRAMKDMKTMPDEAYRSIMDKSGVEIGDLPNALQIIADGSEQSISAILQASSEPKEKEKDFWGKDAPDDSARDVQMALALRAADKMAWICDDWVIRNLIGSRSALADARLNYSEPFTYRWSKLHPPSDPSGTDSSSATSVLLQEALKHPGVKEVEEVYKKYRQPEPSPSAAAVSEEEKWDDKTICLLLGIFPEPLSLAQSKKIYDAHNASLERHAKRVKEKILEKQK